MTFVSDSPQAGTPPPISARNGMLIAAAIVAFGFVGSRLLGVLRTAVLANQFGSAPELAAYNVAFRIPDLIFQVLAGATLGSAFIPVFVRLYRRESQESAWRLASTVITLVTLATAVLCIIGFILAPWLVPLQARDLGVEAGRHEEITDKAIFLTRVMMLSPFLFAVSGMITGILNARQQFLLPALAPMAYNLSIIAGAIFLSGRYGVTGVAIGVVAGAGLHLLVQVPGLFREKMRFRFSVDTKDAAVREVGRLMAPRVVGLAAAQLNFLITTFFASQVSDAAINNLNYAWLVAGLPLAIFGMTISTAIFPTLAEQNADGDFTALNHTVSRALRTIMFLTIPASVGLLLLREPVVVTLFEHGKFTGADTDQVASALGWYCLGIIPLAGIEIHSRGFYALGNTRTPVIFAAAAVAVNLVLSSVLWSRFEHQGLAFSISATAWAEWLGVYWFYHRSTGAGVREDLDAFARFLLCAAFMGLALAVTFFFLDADGWVHGAVLTFGGAAAGALFYYGFAVWLNVPDLASQLDQVQRILARFRRRPA